MKKTEIYTTEMPQTRLPFSQAIMAGNMLFISGTGGHDVNTGEIAGNDISSQAIKAMENIKSILAKAGMTFDDVVKTNIYLTNMDDFNTINKIYKNYFKRPLPARTCVEVNRLPVNFLIEIDMIAIKE